MALRNVVTLSNIPPDLHQWFKDEARRRSQQAGKRVGSYTLIVEALQEYKDRQTNSNGHIPEVFNG